MSGVEGVLTKRALKMMNEIARSRPGWGILVLARLARDHNIEMICRGLGRSSS